MSKNQNQVDILRRTDPVKQIKQDTSDPTCIYIGLTPKMDTLTSEERWQIRRIENVNGVITTLFANSAKYNCSWDNRATYFPVCAGTDPVYPPVGGVVGDITGEVRVTGLTIEGRMTVVGLDSLNWTPLPAVALPDRNTIALQNQSATEIKYNYDNTEPGYVGTIIAPGGERFINITDSIPVYAKAQAGTPSILVEEIS